MPRARPLVFPALALGLSGFETGVVVMPLVKGDANDTVAEPTGRIRHAKKLLTTAALGTRPGPPAVRRGRRSRHWSSP
jgi:hypothetical protein